MTEVIPNLYIGSDDDYEAAKKRDFSICSCCKEGENGHRSILHYTSLGAPKGENYYFVRRGNLLALNLIDPPDPALIPDQAIDAAIKFITERRTAGDKVLVHCNQGHSRGPSVALLYMASIGELPAQWHPAQRILKTLYREYEPGIGMQQYVRQKLRSFRSADEKDA